MSGYVEAGYVVALGSMALYAASVVARERAARHRLPPVGVESSSRPPADRKRPGGPS